MSLPGHTVIGFGCRIARTKIQDRLRAFESVALLASRVVPSPTHLSHYAYGYRSVEGFNGSQIVNPGGGLLSIGKCSMTTKENPFFEDLKKIQGRGKFIASPSLDKSAQRWLNIVAIGLHQYTHSATARVLMKPVCG